MADAISIVEKEDRIRAILGVDVADIPDTTINYPEYFDTALAWAQCQIRGWASLDEEKTKKFHSLALYKTAQMLLPLCKVSVWNVQKEKTTHAEVVYFQSRAQIVDANILDNIGELRADLLDQNTTSSFFGFDRSGRR